MRRYLLVEVDTDGPKAQANVTEIDVDAGLELAQAYDPAVWMLGQAWSEPLAVAQAVEGLLR